MSKSALKIVRSEAQPEPTAAAPAAGPQPRVTAEPLGMVPLTDLIAIWPDGTTQAARERGAQHWAAGLSPSQHEKIGGRWFVSPVALMPVGLPDSPTTVRDYLFVATGKVTHNLVGVYIPQPLADGIPNWTQQKRERFFGYCELCRQLDEHVQRYGGLDRHGRDRLFWADAQRAELAKKHGITRWSARSVREWRAKVHAGIDPDTRGRPQRDEEGTDSKCTPDAWHYFRTLYLDPRRKGIRLCWELTAADAQERGWAWPKYHSIVRRVRRELPPSVADYYRLGPKRWQAKHATFIERDRQAQYQPNEAWVCDHTKCDFWILHRGKWVRPWLTAWADMCSGKIIALAITLQPNSDVILATFLTGVLAHGAPLRVVFDNGRDFRARAVAGGRKRFDKVRVEGAMQRLGIAVTWVEPYHGQSKPIERLLRTYHERFAKLQPTYCGSSPAARPEDLPAKLKSGEIAAPDLAQAQADTLLWGDAFNNRAHTGEGMDGRTPNEVFVVNPIAKRTAPREVLEELCLPEVVCKVGRLGVQIRGVWLGQDEIRLSPLKGREVRVRFNPLDASRAVVFDMEGRRIAEVHERRLTGLTWEDFREAGRRRKAEMKVVKAAAASHHYQFHSKTTVARQVAAQRRIAEQEVEQRKAADAVSQAPTVRDIALLPGAAEAEKAARSRAGHKRNRAQTEALDRAGGTAPTRGQPERSGWDILAEHYVEDERLRLEKQQEQAERKAARQAQVEAYWWRLEEEEVEREAARRARIEDLEGGISA